jgi:hypothetical protein
VRIKVRRLLALATVGSSCLLNGCQRENPNQVSADDSANSAIRADPGDPQQIVLLRSYLTTNHVPGYIGAPDITPQVDSNGYREFQTTPAVAIRHAPRTEIVTNYVMGYRQGTNTVEVITTQKR